VPSAVAEVERRKPYGAIHAPLSLSSISYSVCMVYVMSRR
jgi:hypothetical protein